MSRIEELAEKFMQEAFGDEEEMFMEEYIAHKGTFLLGARAVLEECRKVAERVVYVTDPHDNEMRGSAVRLSDIEALFKDKEDRSNG